MFKFKTRLLSLLMAVLLFVMILPVPQTSVTASALAADEFEAGAELDYNALFSQAYVVNPSWTASNLKEGNSLTFEFRGTTYTETYNAVRHFRTLKAAYEYYLSKYEIDENGDGTSDTDANGVTLYDSAVAEETPVFILAPETYSARTNPVSFTFGAIILGNNAGVNPNNVAFNENSVTETTIKNGWAAATRNTETIIPFALKQDDRNGTYDNYILQAGGHSKIIVDGITLGATVNGPASSLITTNQGKSADITSDVHVQNTIMLPSNPEYLLTSQNGAAYTHRLGLKNVRLDGAMMRGLYSNRVSKVSIDGMYFANTASMLIGGSTATSGNGQYIQADDFKLNIKNSYFYKVTASYVMNIVLENALKHDVKIDIAHNMFYECGTSNWGLMMYNTTSTYHSDNYYEFNFYHNTVVADGTVNSSTTHYTLFNGNDNYQPFPYTINCTENRVVGYRTIFPNTLSTKNKVTANFNNNYYKYTQDYFPNYDATGAGIKTNYSNVSNSPTITDANGNEVTNPAYGTDYYTRYMYCYNVIKNANTSWNSHQINYAMGYNTKYCNNTVFGDYTYSRIYNGMYTDPYDYFNLTYYTDWARTRLNDGGSEYYEIAGASFYNDANYFNVDYANKKIYVGVQTNKAISNPTLYFMASGVSSTFYSNSACTTKITSIPALAANKTSANYYAQVKGPSGSAVTYTVTFYTDAAASAAPLFTTYSGSAASSSALLYAPAVSGMTAGSYYTAKWDGQDYRFVVGTNAFATMDALFAKAGANPQIIIAPGTYSAITIPEPCSIYGYNCKYFASGGDESVYDWSYGPGWGAGYETNIAGITLGNMNNTANFNLYIKGIRLTGQFVDTTRTVAGRVDIQNSIIDVTGSKASGYAQFNVGNSSVKSAANTYYMKGVLIKNLATDSNGDGVLIGGSMPTTFNMDYCHSVAPQLTKLFGTTWPISSVARKAHVWHSRFENLSGDTTLLTDLDTSNSDTASSEILFRYTTVIGDGYTGTLLDVTPYNYKDGQVVTIDYNNFINRSGVATLLNVDYNNQQSLNSKLVFNRNRVVGFMGGFTAENTSALYSGRYLDVTNSYFSEYSDEFTTAITGICPTGTVQCSSYYKDFQMTELVDPMDGFSFKEADELVVNNDTRELTLTVDQDATNVNFDDYINKGKFYFDATNSNTGKFVDLRNITLTGDTTIVEIKITNYNNNNVYRIWTLVINREIPEGCEIESITSDVGTVTLNKYTGEYELTLPEANSGATVTVNTAHADAVATVSDTIADIQKGKERAYTVTVTNGSASRDYTLRVYRTAVTGVELEYEACLRKAYIIDADWATAPETVEYVYRGKTYTEAYNAGRHFASYADAYAHWLETADIINDKPVFFFTAGTYSDSITVHYRAIILGTNAGITPNDPAMDASAMKPGDSTVAANTAWDTANETIISGNIYRTTRINWSNTDLTHENAVVAAENAAGKSMEFYLVVDGVKLTNSGNAVTTQDIDVGNGKGYRKNYIALQNIVSTAGKLLSAVDTTYNYTTFHVNNMRMTDCTLNALFEKYVDNFVLNNSYFNGVTISTSLLGNNASYIQPRHNINYVFKNNVFAANEIYKLMIFNADLYRGDFSKGYIGFLNNYFYDNATNKWGQFRIVSDFPGMNYEISGNTFYEPTFAVTTLVEGNEGYMDYPYGLKVNNNRIIGTITSFFPNMGGLEAATVSALDWDFNDNYFAKTFTSTSDKAGIQPVYNSKPTCGIDPILSDDFKYYLDYAMTVRNGDFDIVSVDAGTAALTDLTFKGGKITATLKTEGANDISGLVVKFANRNASFKVYSDSACTTAVDLTKVSLSKTTTYYIRGELNGITGTAYQLVLLTAEVGYFTDSFVDPAGIIKNTAIMIDTRVTAADGETVEIEWNGKKYKFIVGTNVFSTLAKAYSFVGSSTTSQFLIPYWDGSSFPIQRGGEYFTPNYNTMPFIKTNGDNAVDWDGSSDWAVNPEFNTTNVVAKNLTISGSTAKGNLTLYGFTYTGMLYDEDKNTSTPIHIKLKNTVKTGTNDDSFMFLFKKDPKIVGSGNDTDEGDNVATNPSNTCSFTIENYYLMGVKSGTRMFTESVPAHITIDGLWCDGETSLINNQRCFPKNMADNGSFTIKNSNLRNWWPNHTSADSQTGQFQLEPFNKADIGDRTYKITMDNNILYNYANYFGYDGGATSYEEGKRSFYILRFTARSYSDVQITNNFIYNPKAMSTGFFHSYNIEPYTREDGSVVITGNTFIGIGTSFQIDSGGVYALDKMVINHNYHAPAIPEDTAAITGVKHTAAVGNVGEYGYWLNFDRTMYSDKVYSMTIDGADILEVDHVYIYNTYHASKINLNSYISNPGGNSITGYSDEEMTVEKAINSIYVPAAGAEIYLKITSGDETAEPKFVTVHIVNESEYYIDNIFDGVTKDDETYNVINWRGSLTTTGDYAYADGATFGGAGSGESFGVIYLASTDNLESIKAELINGKDDIGATVDSINANSAYSQSAWVDIVTDEKTAFNEKTQSISYLYKFKVKEGNKRASVMYVIYVDENGEKQILFSEMDVRTSTANEYLK